MVRCNIPILVSSAKNAFAIDDRHLILNTDEKCSHYATDYKIDAGHVYIIYVLCVKLSLIKIFIILKLKCVWAVSTKVWPLWYPGLPFLNDISDKGTEI